MFDSFYTQYGWTYREAYAWKFALTVLVYSSHVLTVALLLLFIAFVIKKLYVFSPKSHMPLENNESNIEEDEEEQELKEAGAHKKSNKPQEQSNVFIERQPFLVKLFKLLGLLASWYTLFTASFTPSILSGLWIIPVWASMLIILFLFAILFAIMIDYYSPNFLNKTSRQQEKGCCARLWRKIVITMKMNKRIFSLFIAFAISYSIVLPLITADICLDHFNYGYGEVWHDLGISTRFSRYLEIDTACPKGGVCQLYATLPEDASTAVIMNVHSGIDIKSITIGYGVLENLDQDKINAGIHQVLPKKKISKSFYVDLESKGARYVHSVFISDLNPNTMYYFEVYEEDSLKTLTSGTYLTLPSEKLERNFIMAVGGDAGTTLVARQMTASLGNYSIDAITIGGDLAYDNGIKSCWYSWDLFLNMFKPVNEKLGRVVPFITVIGNHDIGFNAFQDGNVDITDNIYYIYFPLHSKYDKDGRILNEVPDLDERLSYNYHLIGNTLQLSLDSAYISGYDGPQKEFIKEISEKYPDRVKMANFHVPMYPTCFNAVYDDLRTLTQPRLHWAPLFHKYKFSSVFENHYHLYKVSFPLDGKGDRVDEGGILYFGDGNWGINPDGCYPYDANGNHTGELYNFNNVTHVWLLNFTKDDISHYAINMTGHKFDREFPIKTSDYVTDEL